MRPMRLRVGTSGFSFKEWKGSFYPVDLPDANMLRFYGERFDAVEINNTFYRMPKEAVLDGWTKAVSEDFLFVLKAPVYLTHLKKLEELGGAPARQFFETAASLGGRLGPVLLQLPPYLKKDPDTLASVGRLFDLVPSSVRIALEPTNDTWHDEEFYALLRERGVALSVVDDPKRRTPLVATAPWGYVRLRNAAYRKAELDAWVTKIGAMPWSEAFVFFKHDDEGTGPKLAKKFATLFVPRM